MPFLSVRQIYIVITAYFTTIVITPPCVTFPVSRVLTTALRPQRRPEEDRRWYRGHPCFLDLAASEDPIHTSITRRNIASWFSLIRSAYKDRDRLVVRSLAAAGQTGLLLLRQRSRCELKIRSLVREGKSRNDTSKHHVCAGASSEAELTLS
ncbi:hypothetical protein F4859DRAFT_465159 [Xylaria cf. heliscus]|nr:hypothetical protein F4859DRAFT_465159 [Xylaria cf. heliscus]